MADKSEEVQKAAEFWDRNCKVTVSRDYWTCHPIINEYVNTLIAPETGNILEWFKKKYIGDKPLERGISFGCGTGAADRQALQAGICLRLDGIDVSPSSIDVARREAAGAGLGDRLEYAVGDINSLKLPDAAYDFALFVGSLHHIENLEYLFKELKRTLKQNSFIFINEYVGPSRLQWTEKQIRMLNRVWQIMPSGYRKPGPLSSVDKDELIKVDPSEACRSAEIVPLLYNHFEVLDHIDYGGGFLMPFWSQGISPDIFLDSPTLENQVIVKLLCVIEELMREEEILPNCYTQIVARNSPPLEIHQSRKNGPQITNRGKWTSFLMSQPVATQRSNSASDIQKALHVLKTEGPVALLRKIVVRTRNIIRSRLS